MARQGMPRRINGADLVYARRGDGVLFRFRGRRLFEQFNMVHRGIESVMAISRQEFIRCRQDIERAHPQCWNWYWLEPDCFYGTAVYVHR